MVIDRTKIPDKTEKEAYAMLKQASDLRDLDGFKEAVEVLSKACPDLTYPRLEKEFRKRNFTIYLIALEKDHGDTITNVNMQGEVERKYTISYHLSEKPQRPAMKKRWPKTPNENLERLADAGILIDRGVEKCNNVSDWCPPQFSTNLSSATNSATHLASVLRSRRRSIAQLPSALFVARRAIVFATVLKNDANQENLFPVESVRVENIWPKTAHIGRK